MTVRLTKLDSAEEAVSVLCAGLASRNCATVPCESVAPETLPERFHHLLVHRDHMTIRLSTYYGRSVALRVLDERTDGTVYRRRIVLVLEGSEEVVEFGVVRIDLRFVPEAARREILEQGKPLGDILIRHDVLRRIEPRWYLRLPLACPHLACFGPNRSGEAYGRVGTIYCNGEPAIELLEVVADAGTPQEKNVGNPTL